MTLGDGCHLLLGLTGNIRKSQPSQETVGIYEFDELIVSAGALVTHIPGEESNIQIKVIQINNY